MHITLFFYLLGCFRINFSRQWNLVGSSIKSFANYCFIFRIEGREYYSVQDSAFKLLLVNPKTFIHRSQMPNDPIEALGLELVNLLCLLYILLLLSYK